MANAVEISFTMAYVHPKPDSSLETLAYHQVLWGLQRLLFRYSSEQHLNFGCLQSL